MLNKLDKANITWPTRQVSSMVDKGTIVFDIAVQRGRVWKPEQRIELIKTILEGYPIPAFYANKNKDGVYEMLDGKQRISTINDFMQDKIELKNMDCIEVDGEEVDINGMTYNQINQRALEESADEGSKPYTAIKDTLDSYSLSFIYFDKLTPDQIRKLFRKLNNGSHLRNIDKTMANARSADIIAELIKHDMFNGFSESARTRETILKSIVMKTWTALFANMENLSFDQRRINTLMCEEEITKDQKTTIETVFTKIMKMHDYMLTIDGDKQTIKHAKKIAKILYKPTHLISLAPFITNSDKTTMTLSQWVLTFFGDPKGYSISVRYDNAAQSGTVKPENVKARHEELSKHYKSFFKEDEVEIVEAEQVKLSEEDNPLSKPGEIIDIETDVTEFIHEVDTELAKDNVIASI